MDYFKIKKGDFSIYTFKLNYDCARIVPPTKGSSFPSNRYHYGVTNLLSGEQVILDASETMHNKLKMFKNNDIVDCGYKDLGGGKTFFECKITPEKKLSVMPPVHESVPPADLPPQPIITPPASSAKEEYFKKKDEKIEGMYHDKQESIHVQSAMKLAQNLLSEKDKERTFTEKKIILAEMERWYLDRIEGGLRQELADEKMQFPDSPEKPPVDNSDPDMPF